MHVIFSVEDGYGVDSTEFPTVKIGTNDTRSILRSFGYSMNCDSDFTGSFNADDLKTHVNITRSDFASGPPIHVMGNNWDDHIVKHLDELLMLADSARSVGANVLYSI